MTQKDKNLIGLVNETVDQAPGVKGKLQEQGIERIADNKDMRSLSRTLSAINAQDFNAYYSFLINKIGTQILTASYDNSGFKNTLDLFEIKVAPVGDTLEIFDTELIASNSIDYGNDTENGSNDPFKASKSRNYVVHLKVKPTIHFALEEQQDVISEAFISTSELSAFISRITKTLMDSADSEIWNAAREDLLTGVVKEITTGAVLDLATEAGAKAAYSKITETCLNNVQESKDFNEGVKLKGGGSLVPKLNATPLEKQVVLINPNAFVNFNIQVIASLFNSNKLLGENFTYKVLPFTNKAGVAILPGTFAMVLDKGRFVLSTKMNSISSIYNPMGPSQVTHLNRKMFWGHIPYFNAVKITNKV